jgi:hypothetical protein
LKPILNNRTYFGGGAQMLKSNHLFAEWKWFAGMLAGLAVLLALQYPLCLY